MRRWPQVSHASACPPSAAVLYSASLRRIVLWRADSLVPWSSRKDAPWRRTTSATSKVGRATVYSGLGAPAAVFLAPDGSRSKGLCVV